MNEKLVITIQAIEQSPYGVKIKAQDNKVYNVSRTKKDGTETVAWRQMLDMGLKGADPITGAGGATVEIWYKEIENSHGGTSRYISSFKETNGQPVSTPIADKNSRPGASQSVTGRILDPIPGIRNYEKEAYEKCCSIWAAADLGHQPLDTTLLQINSGRYWELFQAIKKDGEKRFATGWDKAVKTFAKPIEEELPTIYRDEPPITDEDDPTNGEPNGFVNDVDPADIPF